jgi:hypothetical protein
LPTILDAVDDCDAIVVAASDTGLAVGPTDQISAARKGRPLFLATPNGDKLKDAHSHVALLYPLRSGDLSELLVQTLATRVT